MLNLNNFASELVNSNENSSNSSRNNENIANQNQSNSIQDAQNKFPTVGLKSLLQNSDLLEILLKPFSKNDADSNNETTTNKMNNNLTNSSDINMGGQKTSIGDLSCFNSNVVNAGDSMFGQFSLADFDLNENALTKSLLEDDSTDDFDKMKASKLNGDDNFKNYGSAFLGPNLWEKNDLFQGEKMGVKFEYLDLEEFLNESGLNESDAEYLDQFQKYENNGQSSHSQASSSPNQQQQMSSLNGQNNTNLVKLQNNNGNLSPASGSSSSSPLSGAHSPISSPSISTSPNTMSRVQANNININTSNTNSNPNNNSHHLNMSKLSSESSMQPHQQNSTHSVSSSPSKAQQHMIRTNSSNNTNAPSVSQTTFAMPNQIQHQHQLHYSNMNIPMNPSSNLNVLKIPNNSNSINLVQTRINHNSINENALNHQSLVKQNQNPKTNGTGTPGFDWDMGALDTLPNDHPQASANIVEISTGKPNISKKSRKSSINNMTMTIENSCTHINSNNPTSNYNSIISKKSKSNNNNGSSNISSARSKKFPSDLSTDPPELMNEDSLSSFGSSYDTDDDSENGFFDGSLKQDENGTNSEQWDRSSLTARKRRHQFVPNELKDDKYWARRRKNNIAAKRSRDARRMKENQIAVRASYLERENDALRKQLDDFKRETKLLKIRLNRYESLYPNIDGSSGKS